MDGFYKGKSGSKTKFERDEEEESKKGILDSIDFVLMTRSSKTSVSIVRNENSGNTRIDICSEPGKAASK